MSLKIRETKMKQNVVILVVIKKNKVLKKGNKARGGRREGGKNV